MTSVVWICHFSNEEVRKKLDINAGRDFAPWISLSIEECKKRKDIELHVIAPHIGLGKSKTFREKNIHYYFIRTGIPLIGKNWPKFFRLDYWTNYYFNSKSIERIVRGINPDIINLQGAENPHYSSSILRLKDFNVMVNIQGIFSSIKNGEFTTKFDRYRSKIENRVYQEFTHFGIRANFMEKYISSMNPTARFYHQVYPIKQKFNFDPNTQLKEYDIVFFARVDKEKGIEDLLKAILLAKKVRNDITLCIIGPGTVEYISYIKQKIGVMGLEKNVIFKGPQDTQEIVHLEAAKAKISVLPTRNDTLPGTIIESLFLGLPVISYPVGGIPSINKDDPVITFAEIGNPGSLAKEILALLENDTLRNELSTLSIRTARTMFDNSQFLDDLIGYYSTIIKYN